jgi:hypothetical protein
MAAVLFPLGNGKIKDYTQIRGEVQRDQKDSKLPIGRESEFQDMSQFSGIGIVSLEFRVSPEVGVIA